MISICLYFQVHQPFRLNRNYNFFAIGNRTDYFDDELNRRLVCEIAERCYLPANRILLDELKRWNGRLRLCFSISGTAIDQFKLYAPEVIDSFRRLVDTGYVEILGETYYHSLASLFAMDEFRLQVNQHRSTIQKLFGVTPTVFRNTELIYSNIIAEEAEKMGFRAILSEGAKQILGWRSPNYIYQPATTEKTLLLLRNVDLSDEIAFRFSSSSLTSPPGGRLTPSDLVRKIAEAKKNGDEVVNLFIDYETFGEHYDEASGVLDFLKQFPAAVFQEPDIYFLTASEVASTLDPMVRIDAPFFISWADQEKDLTAWTGNPMQDALLADLYNLGPRIQQCNDAELTETWRRLQTSDHFYYLCTKWASDAQVHHHFSPFANPYSAFIILNNILTDICCNRVPQATDQTSPQS